MNHRYSASGMLAWLVIPIVCGLADIAVAFETRIWVDVHGQFSVEARIERLDDTKVVLKRTDGRLVTVAIDQLSNEDHEYLEAYRRRLVAAANPLRKATPERPDFQPLEPYDLPPANYPLPDHGPVELLPAAAAELPTTAPPRLAPDPAPSTAAIRDTHISIFGIDAHDDCSRPIPVTNRDSGGEVFSVGLSVSSGTASPHHSTRHQLLRFDMETGQAYVSLDHDAPIRLLDHHPGSDRSLVLVDYDSLGHGGQLAIATGWGPEGVRLHTFRTVGQLSNDVRAARPEVSWARWVDEEHVVAVIDQTVGMWNLVSGRQLYRIGGIKPRANPALSGGRRYLAVPYEGKVAIYQTGSGTALGVIPTDRRKTGVSFSPQSDRLAIVSSRGLLCWDLATATSTNEIRSSVVLGSDRPTWVDRDLLLTSSGVLVSLFRGVPLWHYDLLKTEVVLIGDRLAMFRKGSTAELSCLQLPHAAAREAIESMPPSVQLTDASQWRILGESHWSDGEWVDEQPQISSVSDQRRAAVAR